MKREKHSLSIWEILLSANLRTGATMTNNRPSFELANLKSISVPPKSAIDTGTCYRDIYNESKVPSQEIEMGECVNGIELSTSSQS